MKLDDIPPFPPHVSDVEIAFGITSYLPDFSCLPQEYQNEIADGCKIANAIFNEGWAAGALIAKRIHQGRSLDLKSPPPGDIPSGEISDPILRFQRCIGAHLASWSPKHEHKIAGVGYLIDKWAGPIKVSSCPRCGSDEVSYGYSSPPMRGCVECHADGCEIIAVANSESEAIAAWNAGRWTHRAVDLDENGNPIWSEDGPAH